MYLEKDLIKLIIIDTSYYLNSEAFMYFFFYDQNNKSITATVFWFKSSTIDLHSYSFIDFNLNFLMFCLNKLYRNITEETVYYCNL